jgi:hypothetical protein
MLFTLKLLISSELYHSHFSFFLDIRPICCSNMVIYIMLSYTSQFAYLIVCNGPYVGVCSSLPASIPILIR